MNEVDFYNEFYKDELDKLGYENALIYRDNIDAELIAWDKSQFKLLKQDQI